VRSTFIALQLYRAWLRGDFDAWDAPRLIARHLRQRDDRPLALHAFYHLVTGAVSPAHVARALPREARPA